jgi:hypothetical protein
LDGINGCKLNFTRTSCQISEPKTCLSVKDTKVLDLEIQEMVEKSAVEIAIPTPNPPRKEEKRTVHQRFIWDMGPIFNLNNPNQWVAYKHLKMEGFHMIKSLPKESDFIVKIDLKDAYFGVLMHRDHRKFLRFKWENKTMQYKSLPFGLACGPRLFTKVMKPIVSILRKIEIRLIIYLDNILLMNQ